MMGSAGRGTSGACGEQVRNERKMCRILVGKVLERQLNGRQRWSSKSNFKM
jgi:hypothetical protein